MRVREGVRVVDELPEDSSFHTPHTGESNLKCEQGFISSSTGFIPVIPSVPASGIQLITGNYALLCLFVAY